MAKLRYQIRDNPAGNPESGVTVTVKTAAGATLGTPSTDSNGLATYEQDGSPGPMVATATVSGRTLARDGRSLDQLGTWYANDALVFWRTLGNGVVPGYNDPDTTAGDMAVSPGTGLQVSVATGATLIDGHLYRCTAATALSLDSNSSGSTRYDRVVVRFTREGQATEGACVLAILKGTPGAGDAPSLTKSSSTFEVSLGKVRVVDSAASFVSGDITDERYATALKQAYVPVNPNAFADASASYQAGDIFYIDNAGKWARLAKGTDAQILQLSSGLPAWATRTFTVTVQEGDVTVDANVSTLDFDASDFDVTSSPSGEANIALAYGTSAGTPAEGNHTHSGVYAPASHTHTLSAVTDVTASAAELNVLDGITASTTELNYVDGVTSNIQTQLDSKGTGTGNVTGQASSVDSEVALFSGTGGKTIKRASLTAGIVKSTSGILSAAGASDLPTGIDAAKIGGGTVSNTEFGYLDGVTSAIQTQFAGKSSTSHTHTVTAPITGKAVVDHTAQSIGTTSTTWGNFNLGPLVSGVVYDVEAHASVAANASSTGFITCQVRIEAGGTVVDGMDTGTENGERTLEAHDFKSVTGTGATINIAGRAVSSSGTGSVNSGVVWAKATPRLIPAS